MGANQNVQKLLFVVVNVLSQVMFIFPLFQLY